MVLNNNNNNNNNNNYNNNNNNNNYNNNNNNNNNNIRAMRQSKLSNKAENIFNWIFNFKNIESNIQFDLN